MVKTRFKANLKVFTVKAPEEGGQGHIVNVLCLATAERKALAALCENPEDALAALDKAAVAKAKIEVPAGRQVCSLTVGAGSKKHATGGVIIKKIMLDSRGGELQVRVAYQEPKTLDGCMFYLRTQGEELEVACVPTQATVDDFEKGGKPKGEKADDGDEGE